MTLGAGVAGAQPMRGGLGGCPPVSLPPTGAEQRESDAQRWLSRVDPRAADLTMATAIYLPKVGMTMEEATLTKWVEADGAEVKRGQVIFEMETEKVQMEVEADGDGRLKQLVPEGAELQPGNVVGCLLAAGEEVPQALLDQVPAQSGGVPAMSQSAAAAAAPTSRDVPPAHRLLSTPAEAAPGMVRVSPVARRLADENGIDVRT